jgi:hypothetical protein
MLRWLWVLRHDGERTELQFSSAMADGELWSGSRGDWGVSPADGLAATISTIAALPNAFVRWSFFCSEVESVSSPATATGGITAAVGVGDFGFLWIAQGLGSSL